MTQYVQFDENLFSFRRYILTQPLSPRHFPNFLELNLLHIDPSSLTLKHHSPYINESEYVMCAIYSNIMARSLYDISSFASLSLPPPASSPSFTKT